MSKNLFNLKRTFDWVTSKYRRVRFLDTDRQAATVAMDTTQLVLSQFKNFLTYELRIEWGLSVPKIISKCCELVKLWHNNRSGPVFFFETV